MNDEPLSSFTHAAKSTLGGILAFYAGLVGGAFILDPVAGRFQGWYLVAWMAILPYTIAKLWGLLLAPLLVILLYGAIWLEWNRLLIATSVAILLAATMLASLPHNPFTDPDAWLFITKISLTAALLLLGILWETLLKHRLIRHLRQHRPPPPEPPHPQDPPAGN